jgi:hypothetical protein
MSKRVIVVAVVCGILAILLLEAFAVLAWS